MEIDRWIWLLAAVWLGALTGFLAFALMKMRRAANERRAAARTQTFHADLLSDTVSRF